MAIYPKSYPEPKFSNWQTLVGKKFGKLEVISYGGQEVRGPQNQHLWNCKCECKNIVTIEQLDLTRKRKTCCGKGSCNELIHKPARDDSRKKYTYYGNEAQLERIQSESEKRDWLQLKQQRSRARQKKREALKREIEQRLRSDGGLTQREKDLYEYWAQDLGFSVHEYW